MKQNSQPRFRQKDWTSLASRNRSRIPHPGENSLLRHEPGGGPHRAGKRRRKRRIQRLDVVGHIDAAESLPSQLLELGAGNTPPLDERAQFTI